MSNDDKAALAGKLLAGRGKGAKQAVAKPPKRLTDHPGIAEINALLSLADENGLKGGGYFVPQRKAGHGRAEVDGGEIMINFSSYDYLGLGDLPELKDAAREAVATYGASLSATRSVGGDIDLYHTLEAEIAETYGTEAALLFVSGYLTNVSFLGYVVGPDDVVIHDELSHNSMIAGARLSGAKRLSFRHNDPEHLDEMLTRYRKAGSVCLVMIEGIYSMDGDIGRVPEILEVARRHNSDLYIDEAHSFGVLGPTGRGVMEHFDIKPESDIVLMNTVSKSLASVGGYIAGNKALLQAVRYFAPGAVLYCAPMPASQAAATLASLRAMKARPELPEMARQNAHLFRTELKRHGLDTGLSSFGTGVVPVITGSSVAAVLLSAMLRENGIIAYGLFHPVVPENAARVRFFVSAAHTEDDLIKAAEVTARLAAEAGVILRPEG
ncbi:MAG: aminotransferase class I/II-fold pyridoxal phosphate-dependent enzyme [Acidimicrobiales bacterium]